MFVEGGKTPVKTPVQSVAGLVQWLETQDLNKRYDWEDNYGCLAHRYLEAHGLREMDMKCVLCQDVFLEDNMSHDSYFYVTYSEPWTYGAALERAREIIKERELCTTQPLNITNRPTLNSLTWKKRAALSRNIMTRLNISFPKAPTDPTLSASSAK